MVGDLLASCEKKLGPTGELGVSACLYDPTGIVISVVEFKADQLFPLASVAKIAVGMALESEVALGHISHLETIDIPPGTVSPGPIANPLDRLFWAPWDRKRTEPIGRLLELMFTHSDNTAADAIIRRLGGTENVMNFLLNEGVRGFSVNRSISELLTYYYELLPPQRLKSKHSRILSATRDIVSSIHQISPAFACRAGKESLLVKSGEDSSTPKTISELLAKVLTDFRFRQIYCEMERCRTGKRRIYRGLHLIQEGVRRLAHKTGSLGGIANDVGIVEFTTGYVATICVMTCMATAPMAQRERCIADAVEVVLSDWAGSQALVH